MPALPSVAAGAASRARRWDVIVLGSSLAALVAAARLAKAGQRVLVVEEEAARRRPEVLREPFLLGSASRGGAVDGCLRAVGVALIDRRRIQHEPLACQVVTPDRRVDVGEALRTAEEWVAWGLAKPESARELALALRDASTAEAEAMLQAPIVRIGRRVVPPQAATRTGELVGPPGERGLPTGPGPDGPWGRHLAALVRARSNLAAAAPGPEARARLLGELLSGGGRFAGEPGLRGLLRGRVEALYGEFRSLNAAFRLVSLGGDPGVEVLGSGELWVGRALVIGVPPAALARRFEADELPDLLRGRAAGRRRLRVHWRTDRAALPEGMGPRVILVGDEAAPLEGANCVTLAVTSRPGGAPSGTRDPGSEGPCDLVASSIWPADVEPEAAAQAVEARVRRFAPFAGDALERQPVRAPLWDDEDLLCDPARGAGWPGEVDIRASARPRVSAHDRSGVAGLGLEGDLLLGWRGGDAVAAELA